MPPPYHRGVHPRADAPCRLDPSVSGLGTRPATTTVGEVTDDQPSLSDCGRAVHEIQTSVEFAARGSAFRRITAGWVAVVDTDRHSLGVWSRGARAYVPTATALDAVVFTNGPMMGRRVAGVKLTRRSAAAGIALSAALGGGAAASTVAARGVRSARRAAAGAGVAASAAMNLAFSDWTACGAINGPDPVAPDRSFDAEGAGHGWIGRFGDGFAAHRIGFGDLPVDALEGVGGLLLLIQSGLAVTSADADAPASDLRTLGDKPGIVAWALLPRRAGDGGMIVVLGSETATATAATHALVDLGVTGAVGTDQGGSVTFGVGPHCLIRPARHRQKMQTHGLCCR